MQQILVFAFVGLVAVHQTYAACATKPASITTESIGPALGGVCPSGFTCYADGAQGDQCFDAAAPTCPNKPASVTGKSIGAAVGGTCPTGYTCYTNGAQGAECYPPSIPVCKDNNSLCTQWVRNGFCTNGAYTVADKVNFCAKTCSLC